MKITYLGLGSNLGNKEENLLKAISLIESKMELLDYSSIYKTSPIGCRNQPDFLNIVIMVNSEGITPLKLLNLLKSTEKEIGRENTFHWGPRIIDIDILYIEGVKIAIDSIIIPHKEMFKRNFVLIPLNEITKEIVIDKKVISIKDLISKNQQNGINLYKKREKISFNATV